MNRVLRIGIYNAIAAAGAGSYAADGAIYFDEAPSDADSADDFLVFRAVANPLSRDSGDEWEESYFDISQRGRELAAQETALETLIAHLEDRSNYTVTGYTVIRAQYMGIIRKVKERGNWNIVSRFHIEIEKN